MIEINQLAILVASLLGVAVGSIWYSPLVFGTAWMKSVGITPEDLESLRSRLAPALGWALTTNLIFFFLLAHALRLAESAAVSEALLGFGLVVFIGAAMSSMVVWEKRPLTYVLIHVGYASVLVAGGIGILKWWPW
jgi:hypothetical protein